MSRIGNAFKKGKAFIGFITAGDPSVEDTLQLVLAMERGGADLIEIGIPFSDPVAEGPVIEEANLRALRGGADIAQIFDMVKRLRRQTQIPLVFLTYLNPLYKTGYEKFFGMCGECGVDGIIIPDMPFEEREEIVPFAKAAEVDIISLIAPTSKERIRKIAGKAEGFIYVVSSLGVTGVRSEISTDLEAAIKEVRSATDVPMAVGFGISTPSQAAEIAAAVDGVIVGSAIVRIIAEHGKNACKYVEDYVRLMKEGI